jgi:RNA polymerase sigma-70 factor (ECF subfamily)
MHATNLRNFLLYKFRDLESAEDVVQECFIKLWQNCDNISFLKAKSYLFTMANNMFLNIKKHEQVVRKHKQKNNLTKADNISPEFIIIEEEYAKKLHYLIDSLPEKEKRVFKMSRLDKMKYKEIAIDLNISVKTVEKRMSLALKFLRENLEYFK